MAKKYLDNTGLTHYWEKTAYKYGIEYIVGTQSAATNVWTGVTLDKNCASSTIPTGKVIVYRLPYDGTNTAATLNLTLPDGTTTGAKNVKYNTGGNVGTTYGAGCDIFMVFDGSYWKCAPWYDSNNYDRIRHNTNVKAASAVTAGQIIVGTDAGYKPVANGVTFSINYPILYAGSAITAAATNNNTYDAYPGINLQNTKSGYTGTTYKMVFLVGTLSGTTFTVNSDIFTQTIPSSADSKVYAPIGLMTDSNKTVYFFPTNTYWEYRNGAFRPISSCPTLATVATSGSYNDLSNKPTIPAAQVQSNWTQTTTTAVDYIKNKPTLATVATSGSYNDLSNKPTIPTVNNATLTIQKNGTNVQTFTANQSTNATANITVPTKTSELTNNSGYITSSSLSSYLPLAGGTMTGATYGYFPATASTMVGNEYNILLNGGDRYTLTQSGTGTLTAAQVKGLFDGALAPQYSGDGVNPNNPYVLLIEGLPNVHTQTGGVFGWTCRYWVPTHFKVEFYDSYNSRGWVTVVEKTNTPTKELFVDIFRTSGVGGGAYTKIRITIYDSNGDVGANGYRRWGISEIFFCHPEAITPYAYANVDKANSATKATQDANGDVITTTYAKKTEIPTVNNATLTIQKNGSTVKTFTANASSNVTANITVPTKTSDLTNDSNFVASTSLATVATSGSYNDLSNKPTIPTVNNATLTIQKNGTTVKTFTANASSNVTANITVPTKISDLTNTSGGFITYCTCSTAAATAAKVVTLDSGDSNWALRKGAIIGVKFTNTNTASSVTLNVNSSGAKSIYYNNAAYTGSSNSICGYANRYTFYMYDGTYWVWISDSRHDGNDNTYTTAYCSTAAGTAAKAATMTGYTLTANRYTVITFTNANSSASALTLNINSKGAKPLYINGAASSSSNYTLAAGSYIVYYDGTNYYINNNGEIPRMIHSESPVSTSAVTPIITNGMISDGTITFAKTATGEFLKLQTTTTDPGAGSALAANTLLGVYEA